MNILFMTRRFYPQIGGVETHVLKIAELLVQDGHIVTILTEALDNDENEKVWINKLDWQSGYKSDKLVGKEISTEKSSKSKLHPLKSETEELGKDKYILPKNIIVRRLPKVNNGWLKKILIWKSLIENKKFIDDADIIHCHDVFFWYLPFNFFYPNKKVFTTFHGYEGKCPPTKKAVLMRRISEKLSRGNICVGDYIKKWYGTKPMYVTYGGTELRMKKARKDKKEGLNILLLGRLEPDIDVLKFLMVLDEFKKLKIDYRFEVCGDGSLHTEVEKYGVVRGFVPNPSKYMEKADIVFASSYLSILDGLAAGKLVISSYSNDLKKDYLLLSPFKNRVIIMNDQPRLNNLITQIKTHDVNLYTSIQANSNWAHNQTWQKVLELYYSLWKN